MKRKIYVWSKINCSEDGDARHVNETLGKRTNYYFSPKNTIYRPSLREITRFGFDVRLKNLFLLHQIKLCNHCRKYNLILIFLNIQWNSVTNEHWDITNRHLGQLGHFGIQINPVMMNKYSLSHAVYYDEVWLNYYVLLRKYDLCWNLIWQKCLISL